MFDAKEKAALKRMLDTIEREWEDTSNQAEKARKLRSELEDRCSNLARAVHAIKKLLNEGDC